MREGSAMDMRSVEDQLDELVVGFQDLVKGIRQMLYDLHADNVSMAARLDEYRKLYAVANAMPVGAAPVRAPEAAAPVAKRRRGHNRPCKRCGVQMEDVTKTRRFCDGCVALLASERITQLHRSGQILRLPARGA